MNAREQGKKKAFVEAYAACGNITQAAELAGISRTSHYNWLEKDAEYPALFRAAEEQAIDRLEAEARRRAVEGVEKPVYQGGKLVGTVREYSDTLLIFLMKGARPEKYRERVSTELSGPGGGPLQIAARVAGMSDEEIDELLQGAADAG